MREVAWRVGEALGADRLVWLPDWATDEMNLSERSLESLRADLTDRWGASESPDSIGTDLLEAAERESRDLWFEEARGGRREARETP